MISSQCTKPRIPVTGCVLVIMIVVKCIVLLFSPLLLVANAQSGGRLGFFARPDFRRPRPWERPTISPVPDTPMPTEKVTQYVTPRARTELPTITPVRPTPEVPISSVTRSPRGRVWARPVFQGFRPFSISTPEISPTESIPTKVNNYSPVVSIVSSTTEPVYVITPSINNPFVDNHVQYKDPNNFNVIGRYAPKITHNNDEIPSNSIKPTAELPITTEKIPAVITEQIKTPAEDHSPVVSSTSTSTSTTTTTTTTTAEPVKYTTASTTAIPFINTHVTYNESLNNNLETRFPSQVSLHLNEPTPELRTTPAPFTTPRVTFISTRASNLNSRTRFPYMSHNLNVPTAGIQSQYISGDNLRPSSTTIAATTELPSSTTKSVRLTIAPSTKVPFDDKHKRYDSVYFTTKSPIPFKIISTTEEPSATISHSIYQGNQKNENSIARNSELQFMATPKDVTMLTAEPEKYITTTTTKAPLIDVHQEYHNGLTSQLSEEYANGYEKNSEFQSNFDGYNAPIFPVYHHETEKVSHYEQSSLSTRKPGAYTVATTTKVPFIDLHKMYDVGFTSGPAVEYTNGPEKTAVIPRLKIPTDNFQEFMDNIYRNNNHKVNDYEYSSTPKIVTPTQSAYQYRSPTTTIEPIVVAQTLPHTNTYRYIEITTKPTTRYTTTTSTTTTTVRPSRVYKAYDIENFKCKDQDAYYPISNQCDDFIECKSGYPIQNTCPDGLHFNPAVKYPEFPCAFPSEVKCATNSVIRQPEPTSACPRRYGYFSMQDGRCDKYIMCQEGLATIMSCPAGLAFSVATSSCDWPANVPDCLPDAFQGFTCPAPELNEDGEPTHGIYKYRYNKNCKKYIACQKGHPRLLSCDNGLAFDQNSESCIDEINVTDCT